VSVDEIAAQRLSAAVGAQHLSIEPRRVIARPGSAGEIADLVRIAAQAGLQVGVGIPAGLSLDLMRMHNILHLDETSLLVSAQAGVTAAELEQALAARGLSLGALPPTSMERTLGALLAAPRPAEAHPRAGRVVQQCAGLDGLLADGTQITIRVAPRKAVGPDLMHAFLGARGATGLITAATLRVFRRGDARLEAAWRMPSLEAGLRAARALLVRGARPADLCVSADAPTLSVWLEGTAPQAEAERRLADRIAVEHGGQAVPHSPLPLLRRSVYERLVPLDELLHAGVPPGGRVAGWHAQGAAVVDPGRAPDPAPPPPLFAALKARLDPDGRFPGWGAQAAS